MSRCHSFVQAACLHSQLAEREGPFSFGVFYLTRFKGLLYDELNYSQNCLFSAFAMKKQKVMSTNVGLQARRD